MKFKDLEKRSWWNYLDDTQKSLLEQSFILLEREENPKGSGLLTFHDYAFVIFPAAKAFEGILKKIFLDMGLLYKRQYLSNHFRIGRALNPALPVRYRSDWMWEKLANSCGGPALPNFLWDIWRESRNLIFHYFPQHKNEITLKDARNRIEMVIEGIDQVFESCKVSKISNF